MALYALEDLDDALDATRAFLIPIDRTIWAKLAVVVFFIGPGASLNGFQYSFGGDGTATPPGEAVVPEFGPRIWLLIAAVVGAIVLVALAFALVGAIMEFVFLDSLRNEAVAIQRYWSRRWRQGLRLFGFRLLIGLFVLGSVLLLAGPFLLPLVGIGPGGGLSVVFLVVLLPLVLVLAVVAALVDGFTTAFVVPIMMLEGCGVIEGWRRLWPTIAAQWEQYLAYAVTGFFLSALGGILVGLVTAVLAVALLVPFGVLFALGVGALVFVAEPVGIALLVLVVMLFGLVLLAVAALVQVPVQTYLRYYALLVLGDVRSEFDLIPGQRAAVREPSTHSG